MPYSNIKQSQGYKECTCVSEVASHPSFMLLKIPFPALTWPLPASLAQISCSWVFHWVLNFSYLH